ncbi:MAG: metal ABC transporter substrate-binding protein [Lentisphaeria bacterium]|nr:metal ABC transporter substrate-binding protein [Lentisphaeria bacterium]
MKVRIFAFAAAMAVLCLTADSVFAAQAPRLRIITTTFPLYDWTRQILGKQLQDVELIQLQDNGIDLHNFQPSVRDIARIAQCDLFVFVGGESDGWAETALRSQRNPRRIAVNLLKELGDAAREEEHLEGMEEHDHDHHHDAKHDHDHDHDKKHDHDHDKKHDHDHDKKHDHDHDKKHDHDHHHDDDDDEHELDEHVWLSLRCATRLCQTIAARLGQLDPEHAAEYQANCKAYVAKLAALDGRYATMVKSAPRKTLLFGDRFPFRYLAEDYGLTCFAAFSGCSAETEASFKTIAFLAGKVDELKLPAVVVLENRHHKIAETVVKTAKSKGVKIIAVDSLQSSTSRDAAKGKTYLGAMEKNLTAVRMALGISD